MRTLLALLASTAFAGAAFAQQPGVPVPGAAQTQVAGPADVRVNQLIIYGDDPCPESSDPNEITVCARLPDADRYRVPPSLRDNPNEPGNNAGRTGRPSSLMSAAPAPTAAPRSAAAASPAASTRSSARPAPSAAPPATTSISRA